METILKAIEIFVVGATELHNELPILDKIFNDVLKECGVQDELKFVTKR